MQSLLQQIRINYQPDLPPILDNLKNLHIQPAETLPIEMSLKKYFPSTCSQPILNFSKEEHIEHRSLRVGFVFSGGQAAGGHNVASGLFDALIKLHPESQLFGFLDGPQGILENQYREITSDILQPYRNQGGFDLLGSGRTKIETEEQFKATVKTVTELQLDGLVIIGGDDSNTNAALLAEYFKTHSVKTKVVGVPKTIDGDLKSDFIEIPFGFDSATKTYSEIIGNTLTDALSAKKYTFFVKLMGRTASHIALQCALATHPNLTFIGEEVEFYQLSLRDLVSEIADLIIARSKLGKDYGLIIIPEGLIEFIPECKILIKDLNKILIPGQPHFQKIESLIEPKEKVSYILTVLNGSSRECFSSMPLEIQVQLLMDRDPHGNVQVSKIETERLFIEMAKIELKLRQKEQNVKVKFNPQPLFCGYEGRSCLPSNFDCQYCYTLGHMAALLIDQGATGYICTVQNLSGPIQSWKITAVPLVSMMNLEERHGISKPVIRKGLVDLKSPLFLKFKNERHSWIDKDFFINPGPIQFFGPPELTDPPGWDPFF